MIDPKTLYKEFLLKINKNDTNTNVKVSKAVFVIIFNAQQRKYITDKINKDESSAEIEDISELLVLEKELTKDKDYTLKSDFILPVNFAKRVGAYTLCSKDDCKNHIVVVWFAKPLNKDVLLQNSNESPSFEYQETIGIINSGKVSVYKSDFSVDKAYLSYYFFPTDIDIEGYTDILGEQSKNISTEISRDNADKVIDRCVVEVAQNYEDVQKMQMALQRQQLNEK